MAAQEPFILALYVRHRISVILYFLYFAFFWGKTIVVYVFFLLHFALRKNRCNQRNKYYFCTKGKNMCLYDFRRRFVFFIYQRFSMGKGNTLAVIITAKYCYGIAKQIREFVLSMLNGRG